MVRLLTLLSLVFVLGTHAHAQDRDRPQAGQPVLITETGFLPELFRSRLAVEPGAFRPVALGPRGSAPRGARLMRTLRDGSRLYLVDAADLPVEAQAVLDRRVVDGVMPYVEGGPCYGAVLAALFPSRSRADLTAIIDPQFLDAAIIEPQFAEAGIIVQQPAEAGIIVQQPAEVGIIVQQPAEAGIIVQQPAEVGIIDPQFLTGMIGLARDGARTPDLTPLRTRRGGDHWVSYVSANPTPHP